MHSAIDDLIDTPPTTPSAAERWLTRIVGGRRLGALALLTLGLVLWSDIAREGWWPAEVFPGPIDVGSALYAGLRTGLYLDAVGSSLLNLVIGYAVAVVIGGCLGAIIAAHDAVENLLGWLVAALRALPGICWLPLAGLWLGWNDRTVIVVVAMGSFVPILVGVERGIRCARAALQASARHPGVRLPSIPWQRGLPVAFPALVTGVTQGWALAWPTLLAAELLSRSLGLGGLLQGGGGPDAAASVVSVMVLIVAVGAAINRWVFAPLERRLVQRWGPETSRWRVLEPEPVPIDRAASGF